MLPTVCSPPDGVFVLGPRWTKQTFLGVVWNRPNFHSSPAIATALDMCLESSGLGKDDMDMFDFYS